MRKSTKEEERAQLNEEGVADGITDQTEAARRGGAIEKKDRWRRKAPIGLLADKIVVCFRLWLRLNWTRGLRENQL